MTSTWRGNIGMSRPLENPVGPIDVDIQRLYIMEMGKYTERQWRSLKLQKGEGRNTIETRLIKCFHHTTITYLAGKS